MKQLISACILILSSISCNEHKEVSSVDLVNWEKRTVGFTLNDSLEFGTTYLSVYSQIYSITEHKTHDLTATISMRNTNKADTIFIEKAEYFDTKGKSIRTYFNKPIYLAPMETVEIVIAELDKEGGTGANFIFDWKIRPSSNEPLFEGVMISTSGQQGLSFTTQGKRIN
ncbi:MAG: DUF3124 domain-containing protein [Calditrichaeota bacterium]|nr:MAG: DUF3124 domain-containing protein [Calditrichota bacterium]